jgi:carboxyl-terminal processing protease
MKRRITFGLIGVLLAANLMVGARVYVRSAQAADKDSAYPSLELFSYVLERVRKDYVDGDKLTYKDLVYGALKGMINTLDPHSEFMVPDKYDELQKDTEGAFGGLGIMIEMRDNYVTVLAPMDDTPGARAGILAGDRIIKINGTNADQFGLQDAVTQLRGEPGTPVTITIMRPSSGQIRDLTIKRELIKVDMVKDVNNNKEFPLGSDKIGYVRLVSFGEKTSDDLETALQKLKGEGMQALIIDLRWNPGGLLDQAVEVCQKFLPRGQLVVSTEGRNAAQNSVRRADGHGDELHGMPMVVLVNGNSASASEIVAGCLQDLHRAEIVGETTFGKGSVQSILPLQDGSALRLTTAKYYTPSHKVIHGKGITPDCVVPMSDDEDMALALRQRPGFEVMHGKDQDAIRATPDPQLQRGEDLLKGILIYTHRDTAGERMAATPAHKTAIPN